MRGSMPPESMIAAKMNATTFLRSDDPLPTQDAVAAILLVDGDRYLMQLRDDFPHIFYPDHWGLFGGAVEPGEEPLQALHRELAEELSLPPLPAQYFTRFDFDLTTLGVNSIYRMIFIIHLNESQVGTLRLGEGAEMKAFEAEELLAHERLVPYDSFAVWLHSQSHRLRRDSD